MMRKIIISLLLVSSQLSLSQIMSIEQYSQYIEIGDGLPQNVQEFKDINGVFHPYLGEWQAQINGQTIKLNISKITHSNYRGLLIDKLITRFEIKDSSGNVIESTMNLPDDSDHMIIFHFISHKGNLQSHFSEQDDCGIIEQIYYTLNWIPGSLHPTTMNFYAIKNENFDKGEGPNCPNGHTPSTFPLNQEIVFTKI